MTAFIAKNATETIGFIATEADEVLTNWAVNLSRKYISIPTEIYKLSGSHGMTGAEAYLGDVIMKPLRAQFSVDIVVVAIVITGHMLEHTKHSPCIYVGEKRSNKSFMEQIRGI